MVLYYRLVQKYVKRARHTYQALNIEVVTSRDNLQAIMVIVMPEKIPRLSTEPPSLQMPLDLIPHHRCVVPISPIPGNTPVTPRPPAMDAHIEKEVGVAVAVTPAPSWHLMLMSDGVPACPTGTWTYLSPRRKLSMS